MVEIYIDKYSELLNEAIEELRSKTDITQLVPGAKARALLEIVNRELGTAYNVFSTDLMQAFLRSSSETNLEWLVEILGLQRVLANRNELDETAAIQKFYVSSGTFADINDGSSITLPAGIEISTTVVGRDEQPIVYVTTSSVVAPAGESSVYVPVKAQEFGSVSNVGANSLVNHNFELYADYQNGTLLTTNVEGIAIATDRESDGNLRYRAMSQVVGSEAGNRTAVRLAALSIPGVADVTEDEYGWGIGTGILYIKGVIPSVGDLTMAGIQLAVDEVRAFGNFVDIKVPPLVGIEMEVGLNLTKKIPAREQELLVQRVRNAIYAYLNSLDINESLDLAVLSKIIMNVESTIKSIGTSTRPFDNIWVWKYSAAEDSRVRRAALEGYTARNFERIIVEFTELTDNADPIRVRIRS